MRIRFLSSRPCALMLGGVFFGMTDSYERFADISPKDNVFAEFIPEGALPVSFFITEKIRFTPPPHCEVYLLNDGIAVYARDFPPDDFSLKIIAQERFLHNLVTVFRQGTLQISLETAKGFFVCPLSPKYEPCSISFENGLFFVRGNDRLALFTDGGKCVFDEKIISYKVENNTLVATLPLSDSRSRTADCTWALTDDGCFSTSFTVRAPAPDSTEGQEKIRDELLPYAFFESVLLGADFKEFLSDELKEKADHLKAFLGEFLSVILTDDARTCGLVRKKKENLFEVNYFTAEVKDGKIVDVKG